MPDDKTKPQNIRWYDRDLTVSESLSLLQNIPDGIKRQVATYLVEDVINRKPYADLYVLDTHYLILSEDRRRRWYDYDETVRIFVELLRHVSDDQKREIANLVFDFIKNLLEADNIDQV